MFDSLTSSLQSVFKKLRGHGKLTDRNVRDALRDVRMALLEADVHYQVVKSFIKDVRERTAGEDVLQSITPGQQVIERVHSALIDLLTVDGHAPLEPKGSSHRTLLLGLHGAGKTTTAAKLAQRWKKAGRKVLLAACDLRRPAAVDQLETLGRHIDVPVARPHTGDTVESAGRRAMEQAGLEGYDTVIFDTGGRLQIDDELVDELKRLSAIAKPTETLLVLDAAIGQESVHVAETFHEAVGLTGLILTKLDGDARGGAALSVQKVTGCPVRMVGMGEKPEDLQPFHPERMASRILGMGDVVSLVEKAQEHFDEDSARKMEEKIRKKSMDLDDFLQQFQQLKKLGPMEHLLEMMPGMPNIQAGDRKKMLAGSEREMKKMTAVIQSMTPDERRRPDRIDASRKRRIARGSGTHVRDVNDLLKRFRQSQQMMRRLKSGRKKGLPKGLF